MEKRAKWSHISYENPRIVTFPPQKEWEGERRSQRTINKEKGDAVTEGRRTPRRSGGPGAERGGGDAEAMSPRLSCARLWRGRWTPPHAELEQPGKEARGAGVERVRFLFQNRIWKYAVQSS